MASPLDVSHKPLNTPSAKPVARTAAAESLEDILYGSLAGILGKYIEYPFDTVKVRLQSSSTTRYAGPLDCFRQSIRNDGFIGLFRGISAPLVGAALETSSLFFFERLGRETLIKLGVVRHSNGGQDAKTGQENRMPLAALWFTGAFSGFFTSFILTPVELVKCRVQVPEGGSTAAGTIQQKPLAVIRQVFRQDGLMGFWHGQMGTLIREAGGSAAWFGAKETTTNIFRDMNVKHASTAVEARKMAAEPLPLWQQAVAGATAGVSYNFLFFPADTVKSRMQTTSSGDAATGKVIRKTFSGETRALWQQAGLRGFYRGCGVTCLRSGPSSAVIFMIYDGLKKYAPLS